MALKKIEQVKKDRGFKLFDIIIYGVVILLIAVLFIVLFTTRDTSSLTGVQITHKGQVVLEYDFDSGIKTISEQLREEMVEDGKGITITICSKDDYNTIYINKSKKTVKMKDANCRGKDCISEIKNNSGFISCLPHDLMIKPLKSDFDFIQ